MKTKRARRSWLHCQSARSPLFRAYTARHRDDVERLESTDAATLNTWFDYLNSERFVRRVVRCRTVRTQYSSRRLSRINQSSIKMVQLVTDAVSIKLGTCNIFAGTNVLVCGYFGYFGGAFDLPNNSNNNIVLSRVLDCTIFTTIFVIFCVFRKIYCARRTERVFVMRTSTRSSSSSWFLLLLYYCIIITCELCEATARIRARL